MSIGLVGSEMCIRDSIESHNEWIKWECGKESILKNHLKKIDILILNHGIYNLSRKHNNFEKVICWGSGKPLREFLYVDDFAEACIFTLTNWFPNKNNSPKNSNGKPLYWLNVGSNFEITIKDLAEKISAIIGYEGEIIWDKSKPDGTPRKKLDNSQINKLGWLSLIHI